MLKFLKNKKNQLILTDSIIILIGLMFCIIPETAMSSLEIVVSCILILCGICYALGYLNSTTLPKSYLYQGVVYILMGLFTSLISTLLSFILGIFLIVHGIKFILFSSELKTTSDKKWWVDFLIGLVITILGIEIVIGCIAGQSTRIISITLGLFLIIYAVSDLMLILGLKRDYSNLRENIILKHFIPSKNTNQSHSSTNSNNQSNTNHNNTTQNPKTVVDDFKDYNIK